jgi:hypothetical protein
MIERGLNGLKLNPKMSQVILIQREGAVSDVLQPELFIGPDSIEMVPKVRNLGFVLNRNLTPVDHYEAVSQRIYFSHMHGTLLLDLERSWLCH